MPDETNLTRLPDQQQTMPSKHILHAALFREEMAQRQATYETALLALETDYNGAENDYNTAAAKLKEEHVNAQSLLSKRIEDLKEARDGAIRAQGLPIPPEPESEGE